MAENLNAVNVTSGISSSKSEEFNNVGGAVVNDLESKNLVENSSDKGSLNDGVWVLGEGSKVSVGELNEETVIGGNGSGIVAVQPGNIRITDECDGSRNRFAGAEDWESWGIMDLVEKLLNGSFHVDEKLEDVEHRESGPKVDSIAVNSFADMNTLQGVIDEPTFGTGITIKGDIEADPIAVNSFADMNRWQGVIDEPTFGTGIRIKGADIDTDLVKINTSYLDMGNGLNRNQDSVSNELVTGGELKIKEVNNIVADVSIPNEIVPDGKSEIEEINDVDTDFLVPKARGEHDITEKEGEYYVSDLVWGKVKSHPWWPGQIFLPKASTDKAAKYFKRGCYLIAYFGDGTFAWNEESTIKPLRMYFSQMEKQRNAEGFRHAVDCALDEVARRVEFGLSCPCLPKEVHDKIKFQVVENAGVVEKYSRREGGDSLSSASLFSPGELMQFIQSLSVSPLTKPDRLQLEVRNAQLMAFNRWKGHYQVPVFEEHGVLFEDHTQLMESSEGVTEDGSSKKRRHLAADEEGSKMKEKKTDKKIGKRKDREMVNSGEKSSSEATKRSGGNLPLRLETTDTFGTAGTKYSHWSWTDKNIEANTGEKLNLENDNKERDVVIVDFDPDESEEHHPTALILNFTNLESIPPIAKLNEIFRRYGPLIESETKISKKRRAKVVFKRVKDAERAFSSSGKFSIFGLALLSYKLNYDPIPSKKVKRNKKDASLKINNA